MLPVAKLLKQIDECVINRGTPDQTPIIKPIGNRGGETVLKPRSGSRFR